MKRVHNWTYDHIEQGAASDELRQVWLPNGQHVAMLHHLSYTYSQTRFGEASLGGKRGSSRRRGRSGASPLGVWVIIRVASLKNAMLGALAQMMLDHQKVRKSLVHGRSDAAPYCSCFRHRCRYASSQSLSPDSGLLPCAASCAPY